MVQRTRLKYYNLKIIVNFLLFMNISYVHLNKNFRRYVKLNQIVFDFRDSHIF